jgi:toxin YoeB
MNVTFTPKALREYMEWQTEDKKTLKKINKLILDIQRNGLLMGEGHPEPVKIIREMIS